MKDLNLQAFVRRLVLAAYREIRQFGVARNQVREPDAETGQRPLGRRKYLRTAGKLDGIVTASWHEVLGIASRLASEKADSVTPLR